MKTEKQNIPSDLLVVEDDVGLNHLIRKTMERKGFRTRQALSGAEALKALRANPETILLLDYLLQDMNARELINAFHKENITVPLIIMTGHGDEQIAVDMMKLGARDYVVKRAGFVDELPNVINHALRELSMEDELRQSEKKFRNYIERAPDGVFMVDDTGRYREVNNAACRITGYSRKEILNMSVHDLVAEESSEDGLAHFKKVMETGAAISDLWHKQKDGSNRCLTINAVKLSATKVLGFAKDITGRKQAEERIRTLNRVYAMLSNINQAIVRIREPQALFKEACRIAVEDGGFKTARIGLADPATGMVTPVTSAGVTGDYLEKVHIVLGGQKRGNCPAGSALKAGKHFVCNDMGNGPCMAPCREDALSIGFHSCTAFPLKVSGQVRGALELYAAEIGFFNDEELKLLDEMAMDVSFAMEFAEKDAHRKLAEKSMRESEARFRILFEQAADIILQLEITPEGIPVIRDANSATLRLLGYEWDELIGKPVSFMEAAPDASKVVDKRRQNVLSGRGTVFEAKHRCKDGTIRDFECSVSEMHVGFKTYAISVERDITERKRAEESLRQSEERYRLLFDDTKDGIALADAETGRLVECNQALCRMVERDKTELVGQMQSVLHPPQVLTNGQSESFVRHKISDPDMSIEEPLISKSGKVIPVEIRAAHVQMNGRDYLLGSFRDISERKHLEKEKTDLQAQLIQAQKLEAVGTLAGGVAHDFNNLLTAINGYIQLAMMRVEESDPLHRDLKQAGIAAARAAGVVRQLLLFSRKQPMEPSSLNLNATVNNLLKMLRRLIGENVPIDTELAPDLWNIQGDEGNVEQVIMNLAINARDAMPQGGRITIRTGNVHIDEEYCKKVSDARPGAFACLSVTDTGTGMDAEVLGHMFEPFFTTKEMGKGTGLGLSVVFGIVKQHDGWITVESKPGQGTTFKIYLHSSYVAIAPKTPEKIQIEEYKGKGERILLVEDQDEVRELAMEVLKGNGYTVFHAESAKKARELFAKEKGEFDLVFSDIVLPDVSGIRLVEELTSGRKLKALLSSGYAGDKAGFNIIKEKNYRFLQKPYTVESLLVAVRETLESEQRGAK